MQEGVASERAHSHAQEGLDDVVGGGAAAGTAEEQEPEEGAQADQQRGQGAVQVPWTGRPGVLRFTGSQRVGHD